MNEEKFLDFLKNQNFPEPILVKQTSNNGLDIHAHDFEVWAMVTEGWITIEIDSNQSTYRAGDIFHLGFKQEHKEMYGPMGVSYLTSRKSH